MHSLLFIAISGYKIRNRVITGFLAYMNRLQLIIIDAVLVLLALLTKLLPHRMRECILNWLLHPVCVSSLNQIKKENSTVQTTDSNHKKKLHA